MSYDTIWQVTQTCTGWQDLPAEVRSLAGHFAGMTEEAFCVQPHSLVQVCLQAGMHTLHTVLPQGLLHLRSAAV